MNKRDWHIQWNQPFEIGPLTYVCGFCGDRVGGSRGWVGGIRGNVSNAQGRIYICTSCSRPSFFAVGVSPGANEVTVVIQVPSPGYGEIVEHLTPDVSSAYDEARMCFKAGAFNACVMMCRKVLMHAAVDIAGAPAGASFLSYIDALVNGGYIAVPNRPWVDKVRALGNEANHELPAMSKDQAKMVLDFSAMILKTLYEYPNRA